MQALQLDDIQGVILKGYGKLPYASFLLLSIRKPSATRQWLKQLDINSAASATASLQSCSNIAFTLAGLAKLGLAETKLESFAGEFYQGMCGSEHRQRILGDSGDSNPHNWRWGGPNNPAIDILLLCYGASEEAHSRLVEQHQASLAGAGLERIARLDASPVPQGKEHFGFRDGLSQPAVAGFHNNEPAHNTIAAGEFILGYRNAYGQYTDRPLIEPAADLDDRLPQAPDHPDRHDLGQNGSYLVFRQLSQDVIGFWRSIDEHTKTAAGVSDPAARIRLAAKMVGRWPNGAPLVKAADTDQPEFANDNDFLYVSDDDKAGFKCPIGAHIRRTHPRDALDPEPGSERAIEVGKRHRILRRGRSYGPPVASSMDAEDILRTGDAENAERGLHFLCFNSHIGRQFEFIQHTWVNNPKFDGLYEDDDPLIGARAEPGNNPTGTFTLPQQPVRKRVTGLPRFVQVRGGSYFFMPGIRALRYLASLES